MNIYLTYLCTCLLYPELSQAGGIFTIRLCLQVKRHLGCLECISSPPWMSVCSSLAFNTTDSLRIQSSSVENELMPLSCCRKKKTKYTYEQRSEVYRFANSTSMEWPLALKQNNIYIRDVRDERKGRGVGMKKPSIYTLRHRENVQWKNTCTCKHKICRRKHTHTHIRHKMKNRG